MADCAGTIAKRAVLVMAVLLVARASRGSIVVFSDEAAFLGAAGAVSAESFEGSPPRTADSLAFSDFTITNLEPGTDILRLSDRDDDVHPTDGSQFINWEIYEPHGALSIDFDPPITALGFTLIDALDQGPASLPDTITFLDELGDTVIVGTGLLPNENHLFFGLISDAPFGHSELVASGLRLDGLGIDEFYYVPAELSPGPDGQESPEPVTIALATLGLAGLAGYARRRNRA